MQLYAISERVSIRYNNYENIRLRDFIHGLIKSKIHVRHSDDIPNPEQAQPFVPQRGKKRLSVKRLFQRLNWFLKGNTIIISDVGYALFGSIDLCIYHNAKFLAPAYYASMGFAVPTSVGAQLADPKLRALAIILNNGGYGTERPMQDGSYNDVHRGNTVAFRRC